MVVVDIAIDIFQSVIMVIFLMFCIGKKEDGLDRKVIFSAGVVLSLLFSQLTYSGTDTVLKTFVDMMILMIILYAFSILFLGGTMVTNIVYNVALQSIRAMATSLGVGCTTFIYKMNYQNIQGSDRYYVITQLIVQCIFLLFAVMVCEYKKYISDVVYDKKYVVTAMTIPFISILICCAVVQLSLSDDMFYFLLSVIGIIVLNVIDIWLLAMENDIYNARVREQILLSSYRQQEQDITAIMELHQETEKTQHEINRILVLVDDLLKDKRYDQIEEFMQDFMQDRNIRLKKSIYSDNNILNYILNRKIQQCNQKEISFKCFVNGKITGIADTDLYILMSNLLDNAVEAAQKTEKKRIELNMYSDDRMIGIEISNTAAPEIIEQNKLMKTTKNDSKNHGFGIENVRDIAKKYDGDIQYSIRMKGVMMCKVVLCKK